MSTRIACAVSLRPPCCWAAPRTQARSPTSSAAAPLACRGSASARRAMQAKYPGGTWDKDEQGHKRYCAASRQPLLKLPAQHQTRELCFLIGADGTMASATARLDATLPALLAVVNRTRTMFGDFDAVRRDEGGDPVALHVHAVDPGSPLRRRGRQHERRGWPSERSDLHGRRRCVAVHGRRRRGVEPAVAANR